MTYGTIEQVAAELGRSTPDAETPEAVQWQQWLERVERAITARFAACGLSLAQQVALGQPDAETVADVEVAAVARKVLNPEGLTSTTISIDDGSITRRRDGFKNLGEDPLTLTPAEWAVLLPASAVGAFSIRPHFEPDCAPWREWL